MLSKFTLIKIGLIKWREVIFKKNQTSFMENKNSKWRMIKLTISIRLENFLYSKWTSTTTIRITQNNELIHNSKKVKQISLQKVEVVPYQDHFEWGVGAWQVGCEMEIFIVVSWCIGEVHNRVIFCRGEGSVGFLIVSI